MSKNEIHGHKVDAFNRERVRIIRAAYVGDPPVEGKQYDIEVDMVSGPNRWALNFQDGPVGTAGANGITNEALLAVVLDRLECFQRGAYKCRENALAITKLEEALHWLGHRSRDCERRGVEGKNEP
jgi:hypothetical protein